MIRVKRVYEAPSPADGERILVDRLWPRGVSRDAAAIAEWAKDLAPSDALRRWYGGDPGRWPGFRRRYLEELARQGPRLAELAARARGRRITLVYAKADRVRNNAVVLREALEAALQAAPRARASRGSRRCGPRSG
jgi:uncharacterized protein YeaO (DUF488 family)